MTGKKPLQPIIDGRYMKVFSAKKSELKDSVVFICLDEERYGYIDELNLRKLAEGIDRIEPMGYYFTGLKSLRINIFDQSEFKNRDVVVTLGHSEDQTPSDVNELESGVREALKAARSVKIVHGYVDSIEKA